MYKHFYDASSLRNAIENNMTIEWKASGKLSINTPDNQVLDISFKDSTYYEPIKEKLERMHT
ncbi:MAG: hypothetical protein MUO82_06795 [Candidatus Thermoplasmatota archaeon]|nr:hypothetical protein [Candidatus Thermoplasmatota archaeon]